MRVSSLPPSVSVSARGARHTATMPSLLTTPPAAPPAGKPPPPPPFHLCCHERGERKRQWEGRDRPLPADPVPSEQLRPCRRREGRGGGPASLPSPTLVKKRKKGDPPLREGGCVKGRERGWRRSKGEQAGLPRSWTPIGHGDRSEEATVTSPSRLNRVRVRFPVTVEQAGQNLSGSMKRN